MTLSKVELALQIIAQVRPAWVEWKKFRDYPVPDRGDKNIESVQMYQDRLSGIVRKAACEFIAGRIAASVSEQPDFWVRDSSMEEAEPVFLTTNQDESRDRVEALVRDLPDLDPGDVS